MTQNHQCVSNQKIQTACLFGRDKRSEEQAVFFALNGRKDMTIYCHDKGRFLAFSFAVSGFYTACHIPGIPAPANGAQGVNELFFDHSV